MTGMRNARLRMGLIGFPNEDYPVSLLRTRAVVPWEPAAPTEADALWISGESARLVDEGVVRVAGAEPGRHTTLDLQALDRPTFFTLPLPDERIRPPLSFDPRSAPSVDRAMRRAEVVLHPLVMQLALAREICARLASLKAHTYHVTRRGKLLAIVNIGGTIGIDLTMPPAHLQEALWRPLPPGASALPSNFFASTFADVLWSYVTRVDTDLLPARYRSAKLYFRAIPRVAQRKLKDTHYEILSELGAEPQTFGELQQNIGLGEAALANALSALYYAGAITSNPVRAAKGATRRVREAESASELRESMFPPDSAPSLSSFIGQSGEDRATVPAPLLRA